MSKKFILLSIVCICYFTSTAQIEVAKIIGKNSEKYVLGFGAFVKFSYPISEADDVTLEIGASVFREKNSTSNGLIYVPLKLGYRYSFDRTGSGFYIEPQLGYNLIGAITTYDSDARKYIDKKINGITGSATAGYLFQPIGNIKIDLGLRFETTHFDGGSANSVSFRLSHYITIGKNNRD